MKGKGLPGAAAAPAAPRPPRLLRGVVWRLPPPPAARLLCCASTMWDSRARRMATSLMRAVWMRSEKRGVMRSGELGWGSESIELV